MSVEENDSRDVTTRQDTTSELSFDDLARRLGSGALSRRQAMRLLGGSLVGSALALVPGVAGAAPQGPNCKPLHDKCTTNVQCCSRFCDKNGKQCSCPEGTEIACNNRCVPTCDDPTDPCKVSLCDPTTGKCIVGNALDGTPCEDGNLCTLGDTCQSGQCKAGPLKTCGPSNNPCAILVCDRATGLCKAQPGNVGAVCRPAQGECDLPALCTGTDLGCPTNPLKAVGTVCRAADGPCDVAETCTGTSAQCPEDEFRPAGTVCRAAAGPCDVAETCTGNSAQCPTDQLRPSGFACGPTPTQCQTRATCTGLTATCPPNPIRVGATCNDSNPCTTNEVCLANGTCQGVQPPGTTVCGTLCCSGGQGFCCPAGTRRSGQCRPNLSACNQ